MVIATTATHEQICQTIGKPPYTLYEKLGLTDSDMTFERNSKEFHIFALWSFIDGEQEIIEPLKQAGFEAVQL